MSIYTRLYYLLHSVGFTKHIYVEHTQNAYICHSTCKKRVRGQGSPCTSDHESFVRRIKGSLNLIFTLSRRITFARKASWGACVSCSLSPTKSWGQTQLMPTLVPFQWRKALHQEFLVDGHMFSLHHFSNRSACESTCSSRGTMSYQQNQFFRCWNCLNILHQ